MSGKKNTESAGLPNGTLKRSQEAHSPLHPKRPRIEQRTSPTGSIGGGSDGVEVVPREDIPRSAKEVKGTLSSQSNGDRKDDRDVPEFRQTQTYAGLKNKRNRPRHKRLQHTMEGSTRTPDLASGRVRSEATKTGKNEVHSDPIEDAVALVEVHTYRDGKSTSSPTADHNYTNSTFTLEPGDDDDEIASEEPPFKSSRMPFTGQKHPVHRQGKIQGKHPASTSEDELQATDNQRPAKRRMGTTDGSSSLSTRGNITKTQYAARAGKDDFGDGLLVKRALAVPTWAYPTSTGTEEPAYSTICLLAIDGLTPDCLSAVDPSGSEVAGLDWLRIPLKRVNAIFHCPGCPIIKITRPASVTTSGTTGGLLMIEFGEAQDAAKCITWVRSNAPSHVNINELSE